MTATALTATTTTAATNNNHVSQPGLRPRQSWQCNTCQVSFDNGQAQREHMKSPWHVYNIKRKIASLPAISLSTFHDQVQPESKRSSPDTRPRTTTNHVTEPELILPNQCLFCDQTFYEDTDDLTSTLEHMTSIHGLFISSPDSISDIPTFLTYLVTTIRKWHECLYCGTTRPSTSAIQSHMRDSGHCKLNFEREPELLEFWDAEYSHSNSADDDDDDDDDVEKPRARKRPATRPHISRARQSLHLSLTRSYTPSTHPPAATSLTPSPTLNHLQPSAPPSRALSPRDAMGLTAITPQQQRALILSEHKAQKAQEVASRAAEWSVARKANAQKHDQAHGPLAKFKGGAHWLLPR